MKVIMMGGVEIRAQRDTEGAAGAAVDVAEKAGFSPIPLPILSQTQAPAVREDEA